MTPTQKLMRAILEKAKTFDDTLEIPELTAENIEAVYRKLDEEDDSGGSVQDAREEVRQSGIETGLPAESSRHYECDAVAAQMSDGTWVGWLYWHGGGKHGEPQAIDWMEDAYDVTTRVMKPAYEFAKA